jgi:hypothetical protein
MNARKSLILATLLAGLAVGNTASADGFRYHRHYGYSGVGVGLVIGAGLATAAYSSYPPYYYYGPRYYPAPVYYYPYPPVVVAPPAPPVYIEQQQQAPLAYAPQQQQQPGYWYYCSNPQGYYPAVQSCAQSWQKVLPQPSSTR